jgi:AcrR family transcriptional regulator
VTPRAQPLPAEERRSRILAAARPLVLSHGTDVTTRQLAAAAGVAEGTLFRVFESKEDLLVEAARSAFDVADHLAELDAIEPAGDLEARVTAIVDSTQRYARRVMSVFVAFGKPADRARLAKVGHHGPAAHAQASDRIRMLIEPDAAHLRIGVDEVARLIGTLSWMSVHPMNEDHAMTAEQVADVLLHGVLSPRPVPTLFDHDPDHDPEPGTSPA